MKISKEYFAISVGRLPEDDDLTRCNCEQAGNFGHKDCGWCKKCSKPVFICGHRKEPKG